MVKDLYVENAQLLKALEMTEQRQKNSREEKLPPRREDCQPQ